MKLGNKMILMILLYSLLAIISLHFLTSKVIMDSYYKLERDNLYLERQRVQSAFHDAIFRLRGLTADWAYWDDTYELLLGKDTSDYINRNIVTSTFEDTNTNYLIIFDEQGEVILGYEYDGKQKNIKDVSKDIIDEVKKIKNTDGLIFVSGKVLAISARQIMDSDKVINSNGQLVFGYNFDEKIIENLNEKLKNDIEVNYDASINTKINTSIETYKDSSIAAFHIPYLNVDKAMKIRLIVPNKIIKIGNETENKFFWFILGVFCFFIVLLYLSLNRVIVRRLFKLRKDTHTITMSKDLSKRLYIKGNDEITLLKDDINSMLAKIESMNEEIAEYATFDMLTGVLNRRAGLDLLEKYVNIANEEEIPLTIAYIDVNNLKEINDNDGHQMGDKLLVDVAKILSSSTNINHKICRLGGDEFLIIFPGTDYNSVEKIFKIIQNIIDMFNKNGNRPYKMEISKGIVQYENSMNIEQFIDIADRRMYKNKEMIKAKKLQLYSQ